MRKTIPRLFAEITATLEDMHAVAVDGQNRDNSSDMQRVLVCQLRMRSVALDAAMAGIKRLLGEHHD